MRRFFSPTAAPVPASRLFVGSRMRGKCPSYWFGKVACPAQTPTPQVTQLYASLSTLGKDVPALPLWRLALATRALRGSPPRSSAQIQVAAVRKNSQIALGRAPLL